MTLLARSNMYQWQNKVVAELFRKNYLVAAQPGSGKTITYLTFIADLLAGGKGKRVLLVAPWPILETVWQQEAQRWEHTRHLSFDMAHRYSGADRLRLWFDGKGSVVTCTVDTLSKLCDEVLAKKVVPFDYILVDESQAFKNPTSVRSCALHQLGQLVKGVYLSSGTPAPNGPLDMWSPGALLSQYAPFWGTNHYAWKNTYFNKQGNFAFRPKPGAHKRIQDEFTKHSLAIKLEDAVDVPAGLHVTTPVIHPPEHEQRISRFMDQRVIEIEGNDLAFAEDGSYLAKLHQLTQGYFYLPDGGVHYYSDAKLEALKEIIEGTKEPVLIGIKFKADIAMIKSAFPKAVVFAGETAQREKAQIIAKFNTDQIPILVGHPSSMGHGLNLQHGSAKTIVWFCQSFSWEARAQFEARLIRNGQKKKVSVITLSSIHGIDDAISQTLERKETSENALLNAINIHKKK